MPAPEGDSSSFLRPRPVLLTVLFCLATALVVISQAMILLSTVRAMRGASSERARRGIEWSYAIVPVLVLAGVLAATWQATTHVDEVRVPVAAVGER